MLIVGLVLVIGAQGQTAPLPNAPVAVTRPVMTTQLALAQTDFLVPKVSFTETKTSRDAAPAPARSSFLARHYLVLSVIGVTTVAAVTGLLLTRSAGSKLASYDPRFRCLCGAPPASPGN